MGFFKPTRVKILLALALDVLPYPDLYLFIIPGRVSASDPIINILFTLSDPFTFVNGSIAGVITSGFLHLFPNSDFFSVYFFAYFILSYFIWYIIVCIIIFVINMVNDLKKQQ
jgi:hypothetical protein